MVDFASRAWIFQASLPGILLQFEGLLQSHLQRRAALEWDCSMK